MSAIAAAVVGGGALALGATTAVALGAGALAGGAMMYSGSKSDAAAAQAAQQRAAAGLASSSDYAAKLSYDLGQEQLAFSKQQYQDMRPIADQVYQSQLAAQNQQMQQAQEYYDYQTNTFRPLEQGLVRQAAEFNADAYREQLASQAAAAAGRAFGTTQAAGARAAAAMGVNPNSGRFAGIQAQGQLGLAAQRAGAMTAARQQADQLGWARNLDVVGLGRNLPGASTAAYSGATGAGTAGLNSAMAPGNQYTVGANAAAGTMATGAGQQISGYGGLLNAQTNAANNATNQMYGLAGSMIGMGGTLGARAIK